MKRSQTGKSGLGAQYTRQEEGHEQSLGEGNKLGVLEKQAAALWLDPMGKRDKAEAQGCEDRNGAANFVPGQWKP